MEPTPARSAPPHAAGRALRFAAAAAVAAALLAVFWPHSASRGSSPAGGFLIDEAQRPVALASVATGEATLVHFWASWCAPCQFELPELVAYARELDGTKLGVLFVAVGDEPAAARRFLGNHALPLFFDPAWEIAHRFGTGKLPETHLLVAGKVERSFIGATRWNDPDVRRSLQKWTATPASAAP